MKKAIGIVVVLLLVLGVPAWLYFRPGPNAPLEQVVLDNNPPQLDILAHRNMLSVNTTSDEGLADNIGRILIVDITTSTTQPLSFNQLQSIPNYRTARDDIAITSPGTVLFEGKVSRDLEDKGSYLSFAGNLAATQIADVIVTDKSFYGYKDNTKIPYAELAKIKLDAKKAYFFVESATLTTIGRKIYDQTSVGSNIKGAAFAANGKVYVSDSAFTYDALLAVDVFDLRQLHPQTSVESPQITKLLEGPKLTQTQAVELSQTLRKNSMQSAQLAFSTQIKPLKPPVTTVPRVR